MTESRELRRARLWLRCVSILGYAVLSLAVGSFLVFLVWMSVVDLGFRTMVMWTLGCVLLFTLWAAAASIHSWATTTVARADGTYEGGDDE